MAKNAMLARLEAKLQELDTCYCTDEYSDACLSCMKFNEEDGFCDQNNQISREIEYVMEQIDRIRDGEDNDGPDKFVPFEERYYGEKKKP